MTIYQLAQKLFDEVVINQKDSTDPAVLNLCEGLSELTRAIDADMRWMKHALSAILENVQPQ